MRDVVAFEIAPKADFGKCARRNVVSTRCSTNNIDARRQLFVAVAAYSLAETKRIDSRYRTPQIEAAE